MVHSGSASAAHSTCWRSLGLLDFFYRAFIMELQRKSGELRNMPRTQDIEKYRQVLNLSWTSVSCDGRCGTTSILKRNFLVDSRKGCPTDCHNMKCSWFDIRQSHHVAQRVMVYEPNDSMCRYGWVCVYSVGTDVERYNFVYCVYIYILYIHRLLCCYM